MSKFSLRRYPVLITLLALLAAYGLAYLFESSLVILIKKANSTFNFRPIMIISSLIPLFVITLLSTLAWLGLVYLPPNRITPYLYLFSGLAVEGLFFSFFTGLPFWLRPTLGLLRSALIGFERLGSPSSIFYIATGSILVGIAMFWKLRRKDDSTT